MRGGDSGSREEGGGGREEGRGGERGGGREGGEEGGGGVCRDQMMPNSPDCEKLRTTDQRSDLNKEKNTNDELL